MIGVLSVAFHTQQPWLVSGSGDGLIKIWSIETGACCRTLLGHTRQVRSVAFSPSQPWVASCGDDTTVRLWNVETGECEQILNGHTRAVWTVAFSPDGLHLASCSEDETVRLWRVKPGTGSRILRPQRPYEKMNITNVVGLTIAQRNTLKLLGAIENKPYTLDA